jgi:hypothetical protein
VHVRGGVILQVQKGRIERGQAVRVGHLARLSRFGQPPSTNARRTSPASKTKSRPADRLFAEEKRKT